MVYVEVKSQQFSTDQRTVSPSRHLTMVQIWYHTRSNGSVIGCFSARKNDTVVVVIDAVGLHIYVLDFSVTDFNQQKIIVKYY